MQYAFLDVETTGLDPHVHEIVELAIRTNGEEFHSYVRVVEQVFLALQLGSGPYGAGRGGRTGAGAESSVSTMIPGT